MAARAAARVARGTAGKTKRQKTRGGAAEPARSGSGPDDRDPQPLEATIDRLISQRGWKVAAAVGGVLGRWEEIVGADVAAHCRTVSYTDGVLNEELGHGTVTRVVVHGPGRGSWRRGPLAARDGRGPRDTYG
jgi:predicted nucleic acid-binding Zn ribbon protein